jgi:hypothetical protein
VGERFARSFSSFLTSLVSSPSDQRSLPGSPCGNSVFRAKEKHSTNLSRVLCIRYGSELFCRNILVDSLIVKCRRGLRLHRSECRPQRRHRQ